MVAISRQMDGHTHGNTIAAPTSHGPKTCKNDGSRTQAVMKIAKALGASMIVLASHGFTNPKRFIGHTRSHGRPLICFGFSGPSKRLSSESRERSPRTK